MDKNIRIHVSSQPSVDYPYNRANKFTSKLPQTLCLQGQWKIALEQIIFSSQLKMLSTLDLRCEIEDLATGEVKKVIFPSRPKSYEELITFFTQRVATTIDVDTWSTGHLCLAFKKGKSTRLKLGCHLAFMLGHTNADKELVISNQVNQESEADILTKNDTYIFTQPPRPMALYPSSIFVYSSQVDYSMCGENLLPIVSILQVPKQSGNASSYQDVQIEHKNFIDINNSELKCLDISLRSHDNNLLDFVDVNAVTYMSFILEKYD